MMRNIDLKNVTKKLMIYGVLKLYFVGVLGKNEKNINIRLTVWTRQAILLIFFKITWFFDKCYYL